MIHHHDVLPGQPLVPALTALGKAMGDRVRASVTAASGAGQQLEGLTNTTAAGRKLLEVRAAAEA